MRNFSGSKSAWYDYMEALFRYLKVHRYTATEDDPVLVYRTSGAHHIFLAVTVDAFLVFPSIQSRIE